MKSIKPIDTTSTHPVTLKAALRTNTNMIDAIYENFDNRSITISTTTTKMTSLLPWITSILLLFPYRPLCSVNDDRHPKSPTNDTTTRSSKYAKIFTPTAETDNSTVEDSFDPSTISVRRVPKANAWANGPPLNVTFDRESRSVTLQDTPSSNTINNNPRTYTNYGHQTDLDTDDQSDSTPLTRPSASMSDITELVAHAMAAERGALDRRMAELERKQNEFIETTAKLEEKLNDMRKQIVDATVKGTLSVLTGTTSPFATKEDALAHREANAHEFQSIKEGLSSTNTGLTILQQHMTLLLQRTEKFFSGDHDPDIASPPRKARAINQNPADSHMTDVEGEGED